MTEEIIKEEFDKAFKKHFPEAIIIDGVNVAGCDFVSKIGGCDSYTDGVCEGHNCEHKQLKRLEQENKELKEENIEYDEELAIEKLSHKSDLETLERYRSALEEINIIVKQLLQGVSSNCINNTPYLTALSLVEKEINEVLQCE